MLRVGDLNAVLAERIVDPCMQVIEQVLVLIAVFDIDAQLHATAVLAGSANAVSALTAANRFCSAEARSSGSPCETASACYCALSTGIKTAKMHARSSSLTNRILIIELAVIILLLHPSASRDCATAVTRSLPR
ncbi:MAG: hypothetical protein ACJAQZ_005108 [Planctomycetota bacterium]